MKRNILLLISSLFLSLGCVFVSEKISKMAAEILFDGDSPELEIAGNREGFVDPSSKSSDPSSSRG